MSDNSLRRMGFLPKHAVRLHRSSLHRNFQRFRLVQSPDSVLADFETGQIRLASNCIVQANPYFGLFVQAGTPPRLSPLRLT